MAASKGIWEGIGGPVKMDPYTLSGIDPTLEACCKEELESNRKYNAFERTLRRHDVVAMAERRRRNLISTDDFDGCRCSYDPNSDGGEYRSLIEYKKQHPIVSKSIDGDNFRMEGENETKETALEESDDSDDEYDYLLDEDLPGGGMDDTLKELEESRRAELEYQILTNQVAHQHGYGTHRQLHPLRVLKAAGLGDTRREAPTAVVLHLVDPDSITSASLDYFLETELAPRHKGTIFVRSGGRSTLLMDASLAQKSLPHLKPDKDMPCLVAIKEGVAINICPRLRGLCEREDGPVEPHAVEEWLDRSGVLLDRVPRLEALCHIRPEEEALMDSMAKPKEEEIEYYDCGLKGCYKTFAHEHVGIKTSEQDGLVVKEETVLENEN
eukprot:scaffold20690_cov113-Cylindrotheca_fusiformis.AAC.2